MPLELVRSLFTNITNNLGSFCAPVIGHLRVCSSVTTHISDCTLYVSYLLPASNNVEIVILFCGLCQNQSVVTLCNMN